MIDGISAFLKDHSALGYTLLFLSGVVENFFPPYPGDTVTVLGAYLAGRGYLGLPGVLLSTILGGTSGAMGLYLLGRHLGRNFFLRCNYRLLPADRMGELEGWFRRYGDGVILASRFLPAVRSLLAAAAGVARMSSPKMLSYVLISVTVWNGILISAGFVMGDNWEVIVSWVRIYNRIFLAIVAVGVLVLGFRLWLKRRKERGSAT
ncbi:MAG: DedA family protein [bacterium]